MQNTNISDVPSHGQPESADWDAVVVGGGAIGICVACYLSRAGSKVLLLEGGADNPPANFEKLNAGPNLGKKHSALSDGRMKAYGGTTKLWGGQLVRFSDEDFAASTDAQAPSWPVTCNEMRLYYEKALSFLGVPKALHNPEELWMRATGAQPDLSDELRVGHNIWLRQPDFTKLFEECLNLDSRLVIRTNCKVVCVAPEVGELADLDAHCQVVVHSEKSGDLEYISTKRVILTAGTLENVAILLRARNKFPDYLAFQNVNIGRFFMDHLHRVVGHIEVCGSRDVLRRFENIYRCGHKIGIKIRRKLKGGDGREVNIAAQLLAPISPTELLQETKKLLARALSVRGEGWERLLAVVSNVMLLTRIGWSYLISKQAFNYHGKKIQVGIEIEQLPNPRSRIFSETESAETVGIDWQIDGREMVGVKLFVAELEKIIENLKLGKFIAHPDVNGAPELFIDGCHDANHHMGGLRYGRNSAEGVVDANNRMYGTKNVYLAGACTFPSGSFANPTLTAIALALRMSDGFLSSDISMHPGLGSVSSENGVLS